MRKILFFKFLTVQNKITKKATWNTYCENHKIFLNFFDNKKKSNQKIKKWNFKIIKKEKKRKIFWIFWIIEK